MKRKHFYPAIMVLTLSLVLFACGPQDVEPSATSPTPGNEASATPTEETSYAGLGLTEDEIKMLEERGIANVDSIEVASKIAGFQVATPAYVPDGFRPGKYSIMISGAGMPPGMSPKFNNTKIMQTFVWQEDENISIVLTQSPQQFGIGGGEPADICGRPGERKFSPADPEKGQPYDKLTLGWEKEGRYYALTGWLSGPLDEAEMEKVSCSMGIE